MRYASACTPGACGVCCTVYSRDESGQIRIRGAHSCQRHPVNDCHSLVRRPYARSLRTRRTVSMSVLEPRRKTASYPSREGPCFHWNAPDTRKRTGSSSASRPQASGVIAKDTVDLTRRLRSLTYGCDHAHARVGHASPQAPFECSSGEGRIAMCTSTFVRGRMEAAEPQCPSPSWASGPREASQDVRAYYRSVCRVVPPRAAVCHYIDVKKEGASEGDDVLRFTLCLSHLGQPWTL
ncbi:hypothetical protein BV20DRAFT_573205 [Pilatotrama ljubarskyi]|nr:hypothetical protein BV20DRAFT_573205 [Pilatotrama ljubarskyi]